MIKDQWFNLDFTYPFTNYVSDNIAFVAVTTPSEPGSPLAASQTAASKTTSPTNITFHPIINAAIVDVNEMLVPTVWWGDHRGGVFTYKSNVVTDGVENESLTRTTSVEIPVMCLGIWYL